MLAPVWTDCPAGACRSSTASPSTPLQRPITRGSALRGINQGSSTSPVRSSPHPRPPGWNGPPLRLSPELRTPPTKSRTTHVGAGTGHRARTSNDAHDISRTSNLACLLNACDLVSQVPEAEPWRRRATASQIPSPRTSATKPSRTAKVSSRSSSSTPTASAPWLTDPGPAPPYATPMVNIHEAANSSRSRPRCRSGTLAHVNLAPTGEA